MGRKDARYKGVHSRRPVGQGMLCHALKDAADALRKTIRAFLAILASSSARHLSSIARVEHVDEPISLPCTRRIENIREDVITLSTTKPYTDDHIAQQSSDSILPTCEKSKFL
jgi:hypothetical protein